MELTIIKNMKKQTLILLTSLIYFLPIMPLWASAIAGNIQAPKRVKKIIVYLEKADGSSTDNQPQTHTVSQKDTHFKPELSIISTKDTIEWINNESKEIDHNIFSLSPLNNFDLGLGEKGSSLNENFDKDGILNYYCSVHKKMEGKIVVLPSRYYQVLEQPAAFQIDHVPAGQWILKAIVFHRRYKAEPIKITLGAKPVNNITLTIKKR